ncbi:hypothetical protein DN069_21420 [Streptacidiphilus pinicola]|uniref:YncE family protein n=1 Tax=Streptacidiphilus pinicola TaxID=2219663 RepID=A0A2X0J7U4_9ACTN|nr:hypothetical protein [Streptacidiphilus pinicola]RAG83558.1 hypothetical protein DN069_21420 [Streptacidiphilus pinicola]
MIRVPLWVPTGVTINPSGTTAYISESCCGVVPVTLATGAVGNAIQVRDAGGAISFTPDGRTAFMPDSADFAVERFTTATGAVDPLIPTANQTVRILLTPDGRSLYAVYNGIELMPMDVATRKAGTPIAMDAWYLTATPDSATVYVSNRDQNTVTPVAVGTGKAGTPIPVGHRPTQLVVVR